MPECQECDTNWKKKGNGGRLGYRLETWLEVWNLRENVPSASASGRNRRPRLVENQTASTSTLVVGSTLLDKYGPTATTRIIVTAARLDENRTASKTTCETSAI